MFDLEPPQPYRLARPPLVQAIAQVKFPARTKLEETGGIAPIQDRLDPLFPYLKRQQVQQVALVMAGVGPAAAESQVARSWEFTNDDGWVLSVAVDVATLSVGPQYGTFDEFVDRFRAVLLALAEAGGVTRCDRLGLRYIDVAEIPPGDGDAWRSWFRPELTSCGAAGVVSPQTGLVASITQTQLSAPPTGELSDAPADVQGLIRHGYVPANTAVPGLIAPTSQAAYLLDLDLFVESPQAFDVESLSKQVEALHSQIDRFFRWSMDAEGRQYFGLEET